MDETGFLDFTRLGGLTYDTKNMNLSENDCIAKFDIYKDISYNYYIVIYYEISDNDNKRLKYFIETGNAILKNI